MTAYRVEKRRKASNQAIPDRKGRGRPKKWTTPWQKKLVALRLCGLPLRDVLELLNAMINGAFAAEKRCALLQLRKFLPENYDQFCKVDKTIVRNRIRLLRTKGRKKPHAWRISNQESVDFLGGTRPDGNDNVKDSTVGNFTTASLHSKLTRNEALKAFSRINPNSVLNILRRRQSYSSSLISDIISLLERASSFRSMSTSKSLATSTNTDADMQRSPHSFPFDIPEPQPLTTALSIIDHHINKINEEQRAVMVMCCKVKEHCIHRDISDVINASTSGITTQYEGMFSDSFLALSNGYASVDLVRAVNRTDKIGNNALFYAARLGAPLETLLVLLKHTVEINRVNRDGQNFLFLLNSEGLKRSHCLCSFTAFSHRHSSFECLIFALEKRGFDFDKLDHNGRSFLSYLCGSPSFDGRWVAALLSHCVDWRHRIRALAQIRDSQGCFLYDFLMLNTIDMKTVHLELYNDMDLLSYFTPVLDPTGRLPDEIDHGKTNLWIECFNFAKANPNVIENAPGILISSSNQPDLSGGPEREMNRYDLGGNTLVMDYLDTFYEHLDNDLAFRNLVSSGVNINARARDGGTLLHIAAKRCCPLLLRLLISQGAQPNHRDNKGFTALNYAEKNLNKHRDNTSMRQLVTGPSQSFASLWNHAAAKFNKKEQRLLEAVEVLSNATSSAPSFRGKVA